MIIATMINLLGLVLVQDALLRSKSLDKNILSSPELTCSNKWCSIVMILAGDLAATLLQCLSGSLGFNYCLQKNKVDRNPIKWLLNTFATLLSPSDSVLCNTFALLFLQTVVESCFPTIHRTYSRYTSKSFQQMG